MRLAKVSQMYRLPLYQTQNVSCWFPLCLVKLAHVNLLRLMSLQES